MPTTRQLVNLSTRLLTINLFTRQLVNSFTNNQLVYSSTCLLVYLSTRLLVYFLICPSPLMSHLYVVISLRAIGPRGPSFWVEIPISAPSPNCAPSVNDVGALTYTHAASTCCWKIRAVSLFSVTIASECPELYCLMWSSASSSESTVFMLSLWSIHSRPYTVSSSSAQSSAE